MKERPSSLPSDPVAALNFVQEKSTGAPFWIFKRSPICPISAAAEEEFRTWLARLPEDSLLSTAWIDVIAQREFARGLATLVDVIHESPQAFLFHKGRLVWHGSHGDLSEKKFQSLWKELH